MPSLLDPVRFGAISLPNRIIMAPLTRGRATVDHIPTGLMATYYAQRAQAGLIVSEAIGISRGGLGWPNAAGLWTDTQVDGWRTVTDRVQGAGGRIVAQLWHMGRTVHPDYIDGAPPISASATTAPGRAYTESGKKPYQPARAMVTADFKQVIEEYRTATHNALTAGFDGVQIHAGNGYLLDQFLRDGTNHRGDDYGGPIEHRIRLLEEVTAAVTAIAGADRTSVRISPNGDSQGVNDSNPELLFVAVSKMLGEMKLSFLDIREPSFEGTFGKADRAPIAPAIQTAFGGPVVLNSDYDPTRAQAALDGGDADAIAFGRLFIANPDLPLRIAAGLPLAHADAATWYSAGEQGYTDYPVAA